MASIPAAKRKNDDVDQPRIEILRRVTFDQADNQPGEDRPFDVAESADDHDGKGLHDYRSARKRSEDENGRQHCAGHAGERGCNDECQHDELVGIDAHEPGGLAILRNRAQRLAQKCEFHECVKQRNCYGRNRDDDDALPGYEDSGKADDLAAVLRLERVGNGSEPRQHQVLHHDRNADRRDQRQELISLAPQWRKNCRVDQPAEDGADDKCHADAGDIAGTGPGA